MSEDARADWCGREREGGWEVDGEQVVECSVVVAPVVVCVDEQTMSDVAVLLTEINAVGKIRGSRVREEAVGVEVKPHVRVETGVRERGGQEWRKTCTL